MSPVGDLTAPKSGFRSGYGAVVDALDDETDVLCGPAPGEPFALVNGAG